MARGTPRRCWCSTRWSRRWTRSNRRNCLRQKIDAKPYPRRVAGGGLPVQARGLRPHPDLPLYAVGLRRPPLPARAELLRVYSRCDLALRVLARRLDRAGAGRPLPAGRHPRLRPGAGSAARTGALVPALALRTVEVATAPGGGARRAYSVPSAFSRRTASSVAASVSSMTASECALERNQAPRSRVRTPRRSSSVVNAT